MRSNNSSGCLTAFVSSFSRIMLLFAWLARPAMMDATFSSFIIPCLGFLFLPFTTLMYVILIQGVGAIQGLDWLWLGPGGRPGYRQRRRRRGRQPRSHPQWLSRLDPAELVSEHQPKERLQVSEARQKNDFAGVIALTGVR